MRSGIVQPAAVLGSQRCGEIFLVGSGAGGGASNSLPAPLHSQLLHFLVLCYQGKIIHDGTVVLLGLLIST